MNVLHVTIGTGWGGVATHLYNLLPKLKERGINIFFISFGNSLLSERLYNKGINVQIIERNHKIDFKAVKKIIAHIKNNSIDIIHMHGYLAIIYGCIASALCKKIKRVVTLHQPSQNFSDIKTKQFKYSLIFSYNLSRLLGAKFIAVSKDVFDSYLKNYHINKKDVRLIYNGIDLNIEKQKFFVSGYKETLKIPNSHTIVSIIGRLEKVKGHRFFIEAAKKILIYNNNITFLIIGDGSLKIMLKSLIKEMNIERNIKLMGFQKDIFKYLTITDILVMSSLFEGIPYTLLEAMILDVNIIATNTGGIKEIIDNYSEGILIKVESSEEICKAVMELTTNKDLANELRKNAKKRVADMFSLDKMADKTFRLYTEMS